MKTPPSHYSFDNKNNMSLSTGVFGGRALCREESTTTIYYVAISRTHMNVKLEQRHSKNYSSMSEWNSCKGSIA